MDLVALLPMHHHIGQPANLRPLPECVAAEDGWTCPRRPGITTTYTAMSGRIAAITTAVQDKGACKDMLGALLSHETPISSALTPTGAVFSWAMGPADEWLATFTARGAECDLRLEVKP